MFITLSNGKLGDIVRPQNPGKAKSKNGNTFSIKPWKIFASVPVCEYKRYFVLVLSPLENWFFRHTTYRYFYLLIFFEISKYSNFLPSSPDSSFQNIGKSVSILLKYP